MKRPAGWTTVGICLLMSLPWACNRPISVSVIMPISGASPTGTATDTPLATGTLTPPTSTDTPLAIPTLAPTSPSAPTNTPTVTDTPAAPWTPSFTPTSTDTPPPAATPTLSFTDTPQPPTATATNSPVFTSTPTSSFTPTGTPSRTPTPTHTSTFSFTPTSTFSRTSTPLPTHTSTPSPTPTTATTAVSPPGTPCPAPPACTGTAISGCVYAILGSSTCLSCHGTRLAPNFSTACSAYAAIVNQADTGCTGTIVIPGNAANSTLIQRVSGTGSCPPMPAGGAGLTAAQIAILTAWINAGAPPAGTNGW